MLAVQPRRILARPKSLLFFTLTATVTYWIFISVSTNGIYLRQFHGRFSESLEPLTRVGAPGRGAWPDQTLLSGSGPVDSSTKQEGHRVPYEPNRSQEQTSSGESDETAPSKSSKATKEQEEHDRFEDSVRTQWEEENNALNLQTDAGALYGNTLATLVNKTQPRKKRYEAALKPAPEMVGFSADRPKLYNPYPHYNGKEWKATRKADFVACAGPDGESLEDIMVFQGAPHEFPSPGFGSYEVLDMDDHLCFERETRLRSYGYSQHGNHSRTTDDWNKVRWGHLQQACTTRNQARFDMNQHPNPYLDSVYDTLSSGPQLKHPSRGEGSRMARRTAAHHRRALRDNPVHRNDVAPKEARTALLIRTFTGKVYSENDKQIIRSLVTELSLRTGGQYQVFLFVHVKDETIDLWGNAETYDWVLQDAVPPEFADMTILWNDDATQSTYTKLDTKHATVHVAQWLSVQKFAQEFSEFDYVWNWELDSRVTGHHFEFLEKIVGFAKKQPRRGLWERNERYYIPGLHGNYDTDFRKTIESHAVNGSVWGPPPLPFINPIGPQPPVADPKDDDYEWGVGEEADLVTLAPIFNPINSSWIASTDVWGYNDTSHPSQILPRRATIITQSRVSRRLLDIMHVENLRGNHISSEMTTQTVALLHGLKAVYAPMPVFFDRAWSPEQLGKWFNGGLNGESGGFGSAMGWGREARFGGSTWYFRANPPQRLYNNWMGWEDTGLGGPDWEEIHGRPCLLPMILHPIKEVIETEPGHTSESKLPYS